MPFRVTDVIQPSNSETNKFRNQSFYQVLDSTDLNTAVAGFQSQLGITGDSSLTAISATGGYKFIVDQPDYLPSGMTEDILVQGGTAGTGDIIRVVRDTYRAQRGFTFEVILDASNTGDWVDSPAGKDALTPFGTDGGLVYNAYDNKYYGYSGIEWFEVGTGIKYTKGITAPSEPAIGEKWFEIRTAIEFTYLGDDEGWVAVNVAAGATGAAGTPGAAGASGPGYTGATIDGKDLKITFLPEGLGGAEEVQNLGRVQGFNGVPFAQFRSSTGPLTTSNKGEASAGLIHVIGAANDGVGPETNIKVQVSMFDIRSTYPEGDLDDYFDGAINDFGAESTGTFFLVKEDDNSVYAVVPYSSVTRSGDGGGGSGKGYYTFTGSSSVLLGNTFGISADFSALNTDSDGVTYNAYYIPRGQRGLAGNEGRPGDDGDPGATGATGGILPVTVSDNPNIGDTFDTFDTRDDYGDGEEPAELSFRPALGFGETIKIFGTTAEVTREDNITRFRTNVGIGVGGETGTGVTKDTNPNGWSSVSSYLARKMMVLDESGKATFDYIRVGDIFNDNEFGLLINSFVLSNETFSINETSGSSTVRALVGLRSDDTGITIDTGAAPQGVDARFFKVTYGPFDAPSSTGGVTLELTSSHEFIGGSSDGFHFLGSVNQFDAKVDPVILSNVTGLAVKSPHESNTNVTLTVGVSSETDPTIRATKNITMKVGNYVHAGFTTENFSPSQVNVIASAITDATAFDGHDGGAKSWHIFPENDEGFFMKSEIQNTYNSYSWNTSNISQLDDDSHFYLALPEHWFNTNSLSQDDVIVDNGGDQSNVVMANLGTALIGQGGIVSPSNPSACHGCTSEVYRIFKSSTSGFVVKTTDGSIKFRVSTT